MKYLEDSYSVKDCESSESNNYSKWGTKQSQIFENHPSSERETHIPHCQKEYVNQTSIPSLKEAAQYLQINYSSAKFIFSQYRDKNQQCDQPTKNKTLQFRTRRLEDKEDDGIEIKFTIGENMKDKLPRHSPPLKLIIEMDLPISHEKTVEKTKENRNFLFLHKFFEQNEFQLIYLPKVWHQAKKTFVKPLKKTQTNQNKNKFQIISLQKISHETEFEETKI